METKEAVKNPTIITANMIKAIFVLGTYCTKGLEMDNCGSPIINLADSLLVKAEIELDFSNEDIRKVVKILQDIDIFPESIIMK